MQTEREQVHQAAAQDFAKANIEAYAAAWRAFQLEGLAAREYDSTRKRDHEARAKAAHAQAAGLQAEVLKRNAALAQG